MKLTKILLPALAGSLFAITAHAQVVLNFTGSTAFRKIVWDRAKALYDTGYSSWGDTSNNGPGTFSGTMSNAIPSLNNQLVTIRTSWSGSGTGMAAVDAKTPTLFVVNSSGGTNYLAPDIALSDIYPESFDLNDDDFDRFELAVIPFVWARCSSTALTGVTNITKEQAFLLMSASGVHGTNWFPATFLGGANTNVVYFTGRDTGSGTRVTTEMVVGFTGTPTFWVTNGLNNTLYATNEGYSSGGLERNMFSAAFANNIGTIGISDFGAVSGSAVQLAYEGVYYSSNAVQTGSYPFWGKEHLVNMANALSSNQQLVRNAMLGGMTNQNYQTTNSLFTANFVDLARMKVDRGADGGPITRLP